MKLNKTEWIIFCTIAFAFILIQARGLSHIAPGDENVYYYMAKSIDEGQLPYKDFFYAHPPLHIFILSIIIRIFGLNFAILKFASLLALLISSFFLYKISLELFKNRLHDKNANVMASLSLLLFLSSFEVMFKATFSMGINYSLMFLMISFYFTFSKKYFVGGVLAGIAGLTRFYALVPLLIFFIFLFIKKLEEHKIKDFYNLLVGFIMTFGAVFALLVLLFGHNFTDAVIQYHFLKPKLPNQRMIVYKNILKEDWMVLLSFSLSLFIKNKKRFQLFYFVAFGYLIFLLSLNVPAEFYFSISFPFMAIIGAYAIVDLIRSIKLNYLARYALIFLLSLLFLWNTTADVVFLEKYVFLDFKPLSKMVAKVSSTSPDKQIFGDDSIVPLLALMSNRSIALNYIDSNEMRFTSGLTNFYLFKYDLDSANLSYIIFRKNMGLHQINEFRKYASSRCSLEEQYSDYIEGYFLMYKCY